MLPDLEAAVDNAAYAAARAADSGKAALDAAREIEARAMDATGKAAYRAAIRAAIAWAIALEAVEVSKMAIGNRAKTDPLVPPELLAAALRHAAAQANAAAGAAIMAADAARESNGCQAGRIH